MVSMSQLASEFVCGRCFGVRGGGSLKVRLANDVSNGTQWLPRWNVLSTLGITHLATIPHWVGDRQRAPHFASTKSQRLFEYF